MDAIESAATKNGYIVEAFSGKNPRSSKTVNHPSGRAADIRIMDPATGKPLGGDASPDMSPKLFRKYEAFANDVHKEFVAANPAREKDFRWGGYFVQGTPMDLMHFDVSGGNMAAGNFKTGLKRQYAQAWGVPGTSPVQTTASAGAVSSGDPQVAALQQQLNARGAAIPVDGIMGPLTRGAMAKYQPQTQAYAPVSAASPAQQAVAAQAAGTTASGYQRSSQIAQMQQHLNSLGAKLTVDGIRGPRTMAAEKDFLGNPTVARTPYTSGQQDRGIVPRAGVAPASTPAINQPYTNYGWADNSLNRQNELRDEAASQRYRDYESQRATARTNPYTNSTGGANAITAQPRPVPTSSIKASPLPGVQLPSYGSNITYPSAMQPGARAVSTTAVPVTGRAPLGNVWGGFDRPAIKTPYLNNPYTMSTGGANAIVAPVQTARMPQPRPAPPPSVVREATLMQVLHDKMQRDAAVASQSSRSGMGYSGGGGGYVGGGYGGYGGGSIASGVGGAFRNR
jgi:hypothetical protein